MNEILNKELKKDSRSKSFIKRFFNKIPKNIFGLFFVFSLILIGSFVFTNKASAACPGNVCYSTPAGSTTGTCTNTDRCTIKRSLAVSSDGDTIYLADGTYTGGINGEDSFVMITKNVQILPLTTWTYPNERTVIIKPAAIQSRVIYFNATANGAAIGAITLDGYIDGTANDSDNIVGFNTGTNNLTFNGTQFKNSEGNWIDSTSIAGLTFTGNWNATQTRASATGFSINPANSAGTIIFENGTVDISNATGGSYVFFINPTIAGVTLSINNIIINKANTIPTAYTKAFYIKGVSSATITDNNVTMRGATTDSTGLYFPSTTGLVTNLTDIHGNTFDLSTSGSALPTGYGIFVGGDGDVIETHTTPIIYNNVVKGTNHGLGFGSVIGGKAYLNVISDVTIGLLNKSTTNCSQYYNIVKLAGTGGGLRAKNSVNSTFYNNIVSLASEGVGIYSTDTAINTIWRNNIIYNEQTNYNFAVIQDVASSSLSNNIYYSTTGLSSRSWVVSNPAHNYNNLTDWKTAISGDTGSINSDPFFTSSSNFKLLPTSPAINAGTDVSLTSDYLVNPIVGTPDIGAYEFQAPTIPTSLSQYKSDGTTAITSGAFTNEDSVVLKFNMSSSEYNSSDLLTPQVEIQESDIPFTNTVTNSGTAVAYSGTSVTGIVTITGLTSGKTYHWQARVSNPATTSTWVSMGGSPDFQVDTNAPSTPITTPSAGTYNSTQSVLLSATGSDYIQYSLTEAPATCSAGTLYSDSTPISIASSSTIYVRACDNTGNFSTQSFAYTIDSEAPSTAVASPVAGTYTTTQSVTLTSTGSDSIRYSTTETPATCSAGTLYTVPISVSTSQTIYVRACDTLTNFSTTNFVYVISRPTSSGSSASSRYNNLISMGNLQAAENLKKEFSSQFTNNQTPLVPSTQTTPTVTYIPIIINRILKLTAPRMWGDDIKALQTFLNTKGYNSGIPDGNFGPKTQVAVIAFQKANNLIPDGVVGPNTVKYLNGNQTTTSATPVTIQPTVTRILKLLIPRMIGDDVLALQTYLSTNGYDVGSLDGVLGTKTQSAIIAFQTANNLTPDGIVGAKTLEMMK